MASTIITNTDQTGDPAIVLRAFSPVPSRILFDTTRKLGFWPYLIRFVSQNGDTLVFRGVHLANTAQEFGADGTAGDTYTVDLAQISMVFRELPSSLSGLNAAASYAILFLSDAFTAQKDPGSYLARAKGGTKWPVAAGSNDDKAEIARLKLKLDMLRSQVQHMLHDSSFESLRKEKLKSLLDQFE